MTPDPKPLSEEELAQIKAASEHVIDDPNDMFGGLAKELARNDLRLLATISALQHRISELEQTNVERGKVEWYSKCEPSPPRTQGDA